MQRGLPLNLDPEAMALCAKLSWRGMCPLAAFLKVAQFLLQKVQMCWKTTVSLTCWQWLYRVWEYLNRSAVGFVPLQARFDKSALLTWRLTFVQHFESSTCHTSLWRDQDAPCDEHWPGGELRQLLQPSLSLQEDSACFSNGGFELHFTG